jgi:hypothetical protein
MLSIAMKDYPETRFLIKTTHKCSIPQVRRLNMLKEQSSENHRDLNGAKVSKNLNLSGKFKSIAFWTIILIISLIIYAKFYHSKISEQNLKHGDLVVIQVQVQKGETNKHIFKFIRLRNEKGNILKKVVLQFIDDKLGDYAHSSDEYPYYKITENNQGGVWCLNREHFAEKPNLFILKSDNKTGSFSLNKLVLPQCSNPYEYFYVRGITSQGKELAINSGYTVDTDTLKTDSFDYPPEIGCCGSSFLDDNLIIYQCQGSYQNNILSIKTRKAFKNETESSAAKSKREMTIKTTTIKEGFFPPGISYREDILIPVEASPDGNKVVFWAAYPDTNPNDLSLWLCIWDLNSGNAERILEFPGGRDGYINSELSWNPDSKIPQIAVLFKGRIAIVDINRKMIIRQAAPYVTDEIHQFSKPIMSLRWSVDGKNLYYLFKGKNKKDEIQKLNLSTGQIEVIDKGHDYNDFFFIR